MSEGSAWLVVLGPLNWINPEQTVAFPWSGAAVMFARLTAIAQRRRATVLTPVGNLYVTFQPYRTTEQKEAARGRAPNARSAESSSPAPAHLPHQRGQAAR